MKKRALKLMTIGFTTALLVSNNFIVHAEELIEPPMPEEITGELNNDKINQYNSEVEVYNQAVDEYNQTVDNIYNAEVEENNKLNEEIEQENIQAQEQYNQELEQYEKDKAIEKQIQDTYGIETVEEYNEIVNTFYDGIEAKNTDENATFDIEKSYTVTKAEEQSPNTVQVHIEHNFTDIGVSYNDVFEINENDTITFYSAGAQLEATQPGYAQFFMNSDADHNMGYWNLTDSELMENAVNTSSGWTNGVTHTVTYKDGTNHYGDDTQIDMKYNYSWTQLQRCPTFNVPKEPTLKLKDKVPPPIKKDYLKHLTFLNLIPAGSPTLPPQHEDPQPPPAEEVEEYIEYIEYTETPNISMSFVSEEMQPAEEVMNRQPRMAQTGDSIYEQRMHKHITIIACAAIILLIIIADMIREKKSKK